MEEVDQNKVENLKQLLVHPGWLIVAGFLRENVDALAKALLDDIDEKLPDRRNINLKRYYQEKLLELPKFLIKRTQMHDKQEATELDPFE
jgi:hypothetical protein